MEVVHSVWEQLIQAKQITCRFKGNFAEILIS